MRPRYEYILQVTARSPGQSYSACRSGTSECTLEPPPIAVVAKNSFSLSLFGGSGCFRSASIDHTVGDTLSRSLTELTYHTLPYMYLFLKPSLNMSDAESIAINTLQILFHHQRNPNLVDCSTTCYSQTIFPVGRIGLGSKTSCWAAKEIYTGCRATAGAVFHGRLTNDLSF